MDKITPLGKRQRLYEILKQRIDEGCYRRGEKLPSVRALSAQYALSKNTVSAALSMLVNNGLAVVRDGCGVFVTGAPSEPRLIGVIMLDFGQLFSVELEVFRHIQPNLPSGYYLGLVNAANRYDALAEGLRRLQSMGAAGYIVVPPKNATVTASDRREAVSILNARPTALINRPIEGVNADVFSMDLGRGVEKALEYLLQTGKTKTCLLLHDTPKFIQEELEAYMRFCRRHGLDMRSDYLIDWHDAVSVTEKRLAMILNEIDSVIGPDALLTKCQGLIRQCGRSIPGELSIIGINNTLQTRMFYLPMTSLDYPAERVGRSAINRLIGRIEGTETSPRRITNFEPELIVRNT